MRHHAKATSSGSNARKPSGHGSTTPSGRLRLAILLATAAAFFLVSAAAASAAVGDLHVKVRGEADGRVVSDDLSQEFDEPIPPIDCNWDASEEAQTGVCDAKAFDNEGTYIAVLKAKPPAGSVVEKWVIEAGTGVSGCGEGELECRLFGFSEIKVKVLFKPDPINTHITIVGSGSGRVFGVGGLSGTPPVNCEYVSPGPQTGACDVEAGEAFGGAFFAINVEHEAAPGSEFAGWEVEKGGVPPEACEPLGEECFVLTEPEIKIKATFNLESGPTVTTTAGATEITQTSAKVAGTVNPNGKDVTECKVEYGLTTSYGSEKACASLPGSGSSPVGVEASLSGLTANTTYHFRFKAVNADGPGTGGDQEFKTQPEAPTVTTTAGATEIAQTSAKVAGTVNPNGGNVTVCKVEYGTTTSYGSEKACASLPGSGSSPVAVSASLSGLTASTTYHFRVVATNAGGTGNGSDQQFTTAAIVAPVVTTEAASGMTKTTATLNGSVDPEGDAVTNCRFEYGLTTSYGSEASCASLPGSGTSPVAVSAAISGLSLSTTYHYRLVATNGGGTTNGGDLEFTTKSTTPPVVTTTPGATEIAQTTAKVAGTVNPEGLNVTVCKVEYGTTTSYGSEKACASLPGSGSSPVAVSASLSGLSAKTPYHFRVVATNADGTTNGSDQTFETLPNAPTPSGLSASEITKTSAKLNGEVNPNSGNVTACKFEYGTTTSYGSEKACASLPGSGSSPVAVSASVTGLSPKTTYHFRLVVTNAGGTTNSSDASFETLPNAPTVVTTAGATEIAQTTAKVAGTVNPNSGNVTACKVEYGTTTSYGSEKACASLPGSGSSPVAVSASLSGLSANTTYHFRVVATNAGGTGNGADQEFTTAAIVAPVEPEKSCANTPSLCPPSPPPPPAEEKCTVPKLAKKTLGQAKSALKAAHCALGKVTKPKKKKGTLVVKSSKPGAGTVLPTNSKVSLKLGPKPKKKK